MEECRQGEAKYLPMENETVYKMWSISSSFRSPDDKPVGFISRFTFLSLPPALRQVQASCGTGYLCLSEGDFEFFRHALAHGRHAAPMAVKFGIWRG